MTMRFWTIPVLAGLLLAAMSGVGFAIPSLNGPTGIVTVPTAYVAPDKTLDYALSYQKFKIKNLVASGGMYGITEESEDLTSWSLQALTGISKQAELWTAYSRVNDGKSSNIWGLGGKVQLTKEPEEAASLAVGGSYQRWQDAFVEQISVTGLDGLPVVVSETTADATVWTGYLVATKDFTPMKGESWEWGPGAGTRMLGSAGLIYKKIDNSGSMSLTRPFAGVEFIGPSGASLGLEYRWKDNDIDKKAVFSAVLRYKFSPKVTAELGTTNSTPVGTGLDNQDIFVRVGYTLPLKGY